MDAESTSAQIVASTCPFCRLNLMDARTAAESPLKVVDVVELMAQSMGLDTTIPENPYTKFQKQDVIVCDPVCKPATLKQQGNDLVVETK